MQLNIHDLTLKRVGFINNDVPNALHYYDDNWHRYLAEGTSTFDFSVNKVNPAYSLITLESYISFTYNDEDYLFNIVNIQQDHSTMQIQCENLNLELISEEVGAYSNTKRHSIVWYLRNAAKITDNVLEIGNNPFSEVDEDKTNPILTFDSTETKLARIISICNSFKAEFQFRTQLKDDGTLQSITLDLYKSGGVGQVRKDVTLFYGKNVAGITSTGDRTSTFFNATTVTDSNKKYDWLSVEGNYINSEGKLEFYKKAGENTAYAILSRDMFPSQLKSASADRYTRKDLSIEASSADSLWDYAVSQFKLYAYPQMTYDVVVSVNAVTRALGNNKVLDIGDTVTIQDSTFDKSDGGLILSARVSEQEISFTNPANNKITFSNFVRLKSQISADLLSRMKDIVNESTPYRAELETTNGVQFKNSAGSTTLTARIYKGTDVNETIADVYEWFKDGVSVGVNQEITVNADDIEDKAVYAYQASLDQKVVARQEVTITDVSDGLDGRSVVSVEQKYQTTATQDKPSDSWESDNWQADIPTMSKTAKYLWQINHTTYSEAPLSSDSTILIGTFGEDGANGKDGNDAWSLQVTNQSVVLPANAQGGVQSYANSGISFSILTGSNTLMKPVTSSDSLSDNEFSVVVKTANNITAGMEAVDTENNVVTFSNASEMDATPWASASITWKISVKTNGQLSELERTQYFTKSQQGITGNPGADSHSYYMYSPNEDGSDMTGLPNFDTKYIGVLATTDPVAPSDPKLYTWSKYVGEDFKILTSATEPTSKVTGQIWQYTGTGAIEVDGVTIQPNTQYIWNGTKWEVYTIYSTNLVIQNAFITSAMIKSITADKLDVDDLSAISTTLTNGKFISNWSSDNASGTTTIEKNHFIINSANASLNTENTIALDNEQGMMMTYTNKTNKQTVSAGVNFQGLFVTDSTGPYAKVTPTGVVTSVDVPWTSIGTYADYKRDGNVVTIRVVDAVTTTAGNITLGRIPSKDGPVEAVMGPAIAWSSANTNDKHLQINEASGGAIVTILNAVANQKYKFQFSYQI